MPPSDPDDKDAPRPARNPASPKPPDRPPGEEWAPVRDSWVDDPGTHVDAAMPSGPPPLPSAPPSVPASEPAFAELMFERLAASDHEGALLAATAVLAQDAHNQDALECAEMAGNELWKLFVSRLGSLDRIPRTGVRPDALPAVLNFRAGYLLARVDGVATVGQIVEKSELPPLDALRAIAELYLQGVVTFE